MLQRVELFGNNIAHPSSKRETRLLRGIVIHAKHVPDIDATSMETLHELAHDYQKRGVILTFVKLRKALNHSLVRAGILPKYAPDINYPTQLRSVQLTSSYHITSPHLHAHNTSPPLSSSFLIPFSPLEQSRVFDTIDAAIDFIFNLTLGVAATVPTPPSVVHRASLLEEADGLPRSDEDLDEQVMDDETTVPLEI